MGIPKICSLIQCKLPTSWYKPSKLAGLLPFRIGPKCEFTAFLGFLSPWYLVCTNLMFLSKGSYDNGEPKNAFLGSVQITHLVVRPFKSPWLLPFRIASQCEYAAFRGYLSPCYRGCTKLIFTSKRSYANGEPKNVFLVSVQVTHLVVRPFKHPDYCRFV